MKILIADDEAHIRLLIEQTLDDLEDEGVDILTAANGEEALEGILEERPELAFVDVMMPKMDGMEVCRQVKSRLGEASPYLVMLTAKGQDLDKQKGMEAGADLFLTKPFDPDEIQSIALRVLGL